MTGFDGLTLDSNAHIQLSEGKTFLILKDASGETVFSTEVSGNIEQVELNGVIKNWNEINQIVVGHSSDVSIVEEHSTFAFLVPDAPGEHPDSEFGIEDVIEIFKLAFTRGSPLVIDLNNNSSIDLTSYSVNATSFFDIDNDGMAEQTGWVASTDGLLVVDKNNNGKIDSQSELFGNLESSQNGFENLAQYDSNVDGKIDSSDVVYNGLQIWRDDNGNGYSESTELYSLDTFNIAAINLNATQVSYSISGNMISHESTVTLTDNSTRKIVDAWFTYDDVNTRYHQDYVTDARSVVLPTLRGYGNLPDLHVAMSLNNFGTGNLLN